jgi:phosphate-selective porin OprO and OprP
MIQKQRGRWWFASFLACLGIVAITAMAQTNDALLDALIKKGILTQDEAREIQEQVAKAGKPAPLVRPSSDNIKDLQILGRIHTQAGYSRAENDHGSDDYSTAELRRVRLGIRGTLFQNFRAHLEANLLPHDFSMRSAYLEWRQYRPAHIRMGLEKAAFGFEETTSSAAILTVERSNINNQMWTSPGTEMNGISLWGVAGLFYYGAGIYTGRGNVNPDSLDRYLYNASVGLSLDSWMPENQKLGFRLDGISNDDSGAQFVHEHGLAASSQYVLGPFDLRVEYLQAHPFGGGALRGGYIMPSYYFTGKLQGVLRYEIASADKTTIRAPSRYVRRTGISPSNASQRGTAFQAIYVGLNYYISGDNLKVMGGFEYSELENTPRGGLLGYTLFGAVRMLF